jgi:hypothetical protein
MTEPRWEDDDELATIVAEALREQDAVPARVIDAGRAVFTWRSVDAELAALTYDSLAQPAAGTRSERAAIREVTFVSRVVTIHLQVSDAGFQGQLVPPQHGRVQLDVRTAESRTTEADEHGWFDLARVSGPAFRLVVSLASGGRVHTDWLRL